MIAGERPIPELPQEGPPPPRRVDLIIDIQNRLAQGKGPAYERWAKVYNLKQMAAALLYLREHGLTDYDALAASTEAAVDRFHALAGELRDTLSAITAMPAAGEFPWEETSRTPSIAVTVALRSISMRTI